MTNPDQPEAQPTPFQLSIVTPHEPHEPTVVQVQLPAEGDKEGFCLHIPATKLLHALLKAAGPCLEDVQLGLEHWHDGKQIVTASKMPSLNSRGGVPVS